MLDHYRSECMGMKKQHHNDFIEPTRGYQSGINTSKRKLMFDGYVKMRESLTYTWILIGAITILNHIDTKMILPR
jgi:hypothetical protein